jgi:hypothetical protein
MEPIILECDELSNDEKRFYGIGLINIDNIYPLKILNSDGRPSVLLYHNVITKLNYWRYLNKFSTTEDISDYDPILYTIRYDKEIIKDGSDIKPVFGPCIQLLVHLAIYGWDKHLNEYGVTK